MNELKYKSNYYDKPFDAKHTLYKALLSLTIGFLSFVIIISYYSKGKYYDSDFYFRVFNRFIDGIKEVNGEELIKITISAFLIMVFFYLIFRLSFLRKKIIVAFDINDDERKISFALRNYQDSKITLKEYSFKSIACIKINAFDGLSKKKKKGIKFTKKNNTIGRLFYPHSMWGSLDEFEITNAIDRLRINTVEPIQNEKNETHLEKY
ncbi:hypothetical protein [Psychroflexus sp. ALD_RP9]|uniref:hypothetical protein n=1 Tax=Psychroflexus sp. ALD_RP9 TaxID=2777186 RepID=UPI001A8D89C0|nr:hypothetical protein [Psychroflexus sp. ALD_RP9]QSS96669.1 hypothetical protein IMZ30_09470 [Psychroflexus sp. ALD_RP9]